MQISMVSTAVAGHRGEYERLFARIIRDAGAEPRLMRDWRGAVLSRDPIFFLMIEDQFNAYLLSATLRALFGLRTVGLLFRGRQALQARRGRRGARRIALRVLKRIPSVHTLSITSFLDDPALQAIADDWLFDPQLWDLVGSDISPGPSALSKDIVARAAGRKIIVALGHQTAGKGFREFAALWLNDPRVREACLFVSAGGVNEPLKPLADAMARSGAFVIDRFITDAELFSLYGAAAMVWACYAPNYDQSSGIVGRAMQLGVPCVIRQGAQISARTQQSESSSLQLDWNSQTCWASRLLNFDPHRQPTTMSSEMKAISVAAIVSHLGLAEKPASKRS